MTQTIKIKRSTGSAAPSTLAQGELSYSKGDHTLYVGDPAAANTPIDIVDSWISNSSNTVTLGANMNANSKKITGVATPTDANDAATKSYVDGVSGASTLQNLTDVTITTVTDGELLVYDATSPTGWINQTLAEAGIQPLDTDLTAIAGLSSADGNFIVGSATGWVAESGATARTSLGLGTGDSVQFTSMTLTGDLTVQGTTTTVDSTVVTIEDPVFSLGVASPVPNDGKDRGIEFNYNLGAGDKVGFFGYDISSGKFTFIPDATNTSEVFSGTTGTVVANIEVPSTLTLDSVGVTAIQTAAEIASPGFADNDTSLLTAAAIDDRILSYGYTTNTGDITGVTLENGVSDGTGGDTDASIVFGVLGSTANSGTAASGDASFVIRVATIDGGTY